MSYSFPKDIQLLVDQLMATGRHPSVDDLLREALTVFPADCTGDEDDLEAVLEAIDDLEGGDKGMELDQAFQEIRHAVEYQLKQPGNLRTNDIG